MQRVTDLPDIKIAPSILAADFCRLGEEVSTVLRGGADYIHVDVMDGIFVPNISIGVPVIKSLRSAFPDAFLDVHLMITQPGRYVDAFCRAGADLLTMHAEADRPQNIDSALADVKAHGKKCGLSIKPKTPAAVLDPWIDGLDLVLVMTVEPGFGGQSFMAEQLPKIREIRAMLDGRNPLCELEVDGGVDPDTAPLCRKAGAGVLVAGSAVFGKADRTRAIEKIRSDC
jgi:ribulose-phosphate 3-epimerase